MNQGQYSEERSSEPIYEQKPTTTTKNQTSSKIIALSNSENNDVGSILDDNLEELDGGHFRCRVCGKDSTGMTKTRRDALKSNMKKHVETHVEGLSYSCQLCGKEFRSKNSLQVHKSTFHKNK